ncbi:MAG: signal peptidase I [Acidaminococcus sp.]|jgi:signal peptidase I|nr:signal peptidase I [Acidaminococcus sp.]MCI2099949.1 signal peptidase I [Acidaminococcus sp.]MCI2114180.1 signal peptidase I [Acidaminococcus sp.]
MAEEKKNKTWQDVASDWLISIIVAVVLAFAIRTFLVEPYMVSGPSMRPTLQNAERLIVNKLVYYTRDPKKGEIIVFKYPSDTRRDFIKRVIATGGDTIEIKDGQTYVNGEALNETYIKEPFHTNYPKVTVPKGFIFVMGDNRNNSEDSRYSDVGFVDLKLVKGKASVVFWPLSAFKTLP